MKDLILIKDFVEVRDIADKILTQNIELLLNNLDSPVLFEPSLY